MSIPDDPAQIARRDRGSRPQVFRAFLKLGLTSFGGPIAHLDYFRAELRRAHQDRSAHGWLAKTSVEPSLRNNRTL